MLPICKQARPIQRLGTAMQKSGASGNRALL
jgi:hypothetical protein